MYIDRQEYRSIYQSIHRSILDRVLVDTRSSIGRYATEYRPMYRLIHRRILLSVDGGSLILHRYFTDTSPILHRYFTDTSPILYLHRMYWLISVNILVDISVDTRSVDRCSSIGRYISRQIGLHLGRQYLVSVDTSVYNIQYRSIYQSIVSVDLSVDISVVGIQYPSIYRSIVSIRSICRLIVSSIGQYIGRQYRSMYRWTVSFDVSVDGIQYRWIHRSSCRSRHRSICRSRHRSTSRSTHQSIYRSIYTSVDRIFSTIRICLFYCAFCHCYAGAMVPSRRNRKGNRNDNVIFTTQ